MSSTYGVELTARASRDLRILFFRIRAHETRSAFRWFNGLERAIGTLKRSPHSCPLVPEASTRRAVHHLLDGRKPHVYRILYQVAESRRVVVILHIRHGARQPADGSK